MHLPSMKEDPSLFPSISKKVCVFVWGAKNLMFLKRSHTNVHFSSLSPSILMEYPKRLFEEVTLNMSLSSQSLQWPPITLGQKSQVLHGLTFPPAFQAWVVQLSLAPSVYTHCHLQFIHNHFASWPYMCCFFGPAWSPLTISFQLSSGFAKGFFPDPRPV